MTINNSSNARTYVTMVEDGTEIEIQKGLGKRKIENEKSGRFSFLYYCLKNKYQYAVEKVLQDASYRVR